MYIFLVYFTQSANTSLFETDSPALTTCCFDNLIFFEVHILAYKYTKP